MRRIILLACALAQVFGIGAGAQERAAGQVSERANTVVTLTLPT